jgi:glycosyltransferase involved in cell wall biosynthesis
MHRQKAISIIVPTLNEEENVKPLTRRISQAFQKSGISYEIIFIDDNSVDNTVRSIKQLAHDYPVTVYSKDGERGKAFSLLEGFKKASYDIICMIDADLQYPPEAIVPMFKLIHDKNADMVITEREDHETGKLRQVASKTFNFVFTRVLFGFDYDSQSGLKVFKKSVLDALDLHPTPWSFDLEFIVRALERDFKIISHKIHFDQRAYGSTKLKIVEVTYELAKASIQLRLNSSPKKVRHSYRKNLEFSRKVLGSFTAFALMLCLTVSLGSMTQTAAAHTLSAQAQVVQGASDKVVTPLVTEVKPTQTAPTTSPAQPTSPTPTTTNPAAPVVAPTQPTPQPTATPQPVQSTRTPVQPTSPAYYGSVLSAESTPTPTDEATYPQYLGATQSEYKEEPVAKSKLPVYLLIAAGLLVALTVILMASKRVLGLKHA